MDVRVGLGRKLSAEELMLLNVVLEKTLASLLDCKIQPVHPKGDQSLVFIGRTDVDGEGALKQGKSAQGSPMAEHLGARNSARSGL